MTTTMAAPPAVAGSGVDRVDGRLKVTGAARYPSDFSLPEMAHAALVRSTIAAGTIVRLDTDRAAASPGVLAVITHENAGRLRKARRNMVYPLPTPPLQNAKISYNGQYVAMVVAETRQQAAAAARLVEVTYDRDEPALHPRDSGAKPRSNPYFMDMKRGNVMAAMAAAEVTVEATFTTSAQTHNPLGPFTTMAHWAGDALTVYDSTQNPFLVRAMLAGSFGLADEKVRVLSPFVGGGFGAGLRSWPHSILAALAARTVNRPVQLSLTRPEMFTGIGRRPTTGQRLKIAAARDGTLVAIDHYGVSTASMSSDSLYPITIGTTAAYACPNVTARDKRVRLNIPPISHMRAPGIAEGNFALESLLDELSYELGMDPIELRLRNYAAVDPQTGLRWSSKALRECYEAGAERFGWAEREPAVGAMHDGRWLVGYGMAGVTFIQNHAKCRARATMRHDGTAHVCSGATDIGTGTYTVMTQLAAEVLGLAVDRVEFELGDTRLPRAPEAGGSGLTAALGSAVHNSCVALVQRFLGLVSNDPKSPLQGCAIGDVVASDGRLARADDESRGESYAEILQRHGLDELTADGDRAPPRAAKGVLVGALAVSWLGRFGRELVDASHATIPASAFGARFAEVRVDPELGILRISRIVSVTDGGRIVNEKLARSQLIGGTVGGIGMATLEETATDPGSGRVANATLSDYLVAVNADVPDIDVGFVGEPDPSNPIGAKGIGELGLVGVAAAIANGVYHATGRRIRSLPITIDQLL
ncbi:MAG TPA: xanthine dehydrogenase family protein molybdopterin-binding subunit [Streptosporangiaceae bacterium]|nr:xanthine dehydrogenase family protein molybdopterin-binding subunit [Streptosporangiaceae bacterium]